MIDNNTAFEEFYAIRENTSLCIGVMKNYVLNKKLNEHPLVKNLGGCVIYGEGGPVHYRKISDHPKVRAKMGAHK